MSYPEFDTPQGHSTGPSPAEGCWKTSIKLLLIAASAYIGIVLLGVLLMFHMGQQRFKVTDVRPDARAIAKLRAAGWPDSIHRIVEAASSVGIHGNGISVDIYCFAPRDVQRVKDNIGQGRPWQAGYSNFPLALREFKNRIPADLYIEATTAQDAYQFLTDEKQGQWHVIDTARGIYYGILARN